MPATRSDRRSRKTSGTQRVSAQASPDGFQDAPTPWSPGDITEPKVATEAEEVTAPSQGISILKEIFPEHDAQTETSTAKAPPKPALQQLLGSIPSPARAPFCGNSAQPNVVPFGPPAHAPMAMAAPVMPPPPPLLPAPTCQEQWEPPRGAAAPPLPEAGFGGSYRERLRAGGRGAFQRAFDIGLMPKNMKQDVHNGAMPYAAVGNSQQMWSGADQMQSNDYCGMPVQGQYQCMQQAVPPSPELHMQQQMPSLPVQSPMQQPQMPLMMPPMAVQQPVQMVPMAQGDQSPQMGHMQMPQIPVAQMQLPQMAMAPGVQTPTSSGESTPTEIESMCRRECMAMLMPQASQFFPPDQDMLAAQLKAASEDCQRYED